MTSFSKFHQPQYRFPTVWSSTPTRTNKKEAQILILEFETTSDDVDDARRCAIIHFTSSSLFFFLFWFGLVVSSIFTIFKILGLESKMKSWVGWFALFVLEVARKMM